MDSEGTTPKREEIEREKRRRGRIERKTKMKEIR